MRALTHCNHLTVISIELISVLFENKTPQIDKTCGSGSGRANEVHIPEDL